MKIVVGGERIGQAPAFQQVSQSPNQGAKCVADGGEDRQDEMKC